MNVGSGICPVYKLVKRDLVTIYIRIPPKSVQWDIATQLFNVVIFVSYNYKTIATVNVVVSECAPNLKMLHVCKISIVDWFVYTFAVNCG